MTSYPAEGGELRLVVPGGGAVSRILAITVLDSVIPVFASLEKALAPKAQRGDPAVAPPPGGQAASAPAARPR